MVMIVQKISKGDLRGWSGGEGRARCIVRRCFERDEADGGRRKETVTQRAGRQSECRGAMTKATYLSPQQPSFAMAGPEGKKVRRPRPQPPLSSSSPRPFPAARCMDRTGEFKTLLAKGKKNRAAVGEGKGPATSIGGVGKRKQVEPFLDFARKIVRCHGNERRVMHTGKRV